MNDSYVECLVKRATPSYAGFLKATLILIFAISFLLCMVNPLFFILLVIVGAVGYWLIIRLNIEWEYIMMGDTLAIDRIVNKNSRKTILKVELEKMQAMAPAGSSAVSGFAKSGQYKFLNYTSGTKGAQVYYLVYSGKDKPQILMLEPSEKMIKALRYAYPRVVSQY